MSPPEKETSRKKSVYVHMESVTFAGQDGLTRAYPRHLCRVARKRLNVAYSPKYLPPVLYCGKHFM